jgi:hypothetical protein
MYVNAVPANISISQFVQLNPQVEVRDSSVTISMWLVNNSDWTFSLATGETFRSARPRSGTTLLKSDPIRVGIEVFPISRSDGLATQFLRYEEGYSITDSKEWVVSWIGGNVVLPDAHFAELLLNIRSGLVPTGVRLHIEDLEYPVMRYGVETVHWDNLLKEKRLLTILDVEFTYSILKERFVIDPNKAD